LKPFSRRVFSPALRIWSRVFGLAMRNKYDRSS
jgi:hypothetical protein